MPLLCDGTLMANENRKKQQQNKFSFLLKYSKKII